MSLPPIGGTFNFGGAPDFKSADGGFGDLYKNLVKGYDQQYRDTLAGYGQVLGYQQQAQQAVQQGYGALKDEVMGSLAGVEAPQRQQIADLYAQQQGKAMQGLASSGLGNTTVTSSIGRGLLADRVKREMELTGQMGQLRAGYQTQLGQAALAYQGQGIRDNSALASQQLGWMGDYGLRAGGSLAGVGAQGAQFAESKRQYEESKPYEIGIQAPVASGMFVSGDMSRAAPTTRYMYDPRSGSKTYIGG